MDFYITRPGQEADLKGPFSKEQLTQMWRSGELSPDTLYATEGMTEWRLLEQLLSPQSEQQGKSTKENQPKTAKPPMEPWAVLAGRWIGERWRFLKPQLKRAWASATTKAGDFIRTISCAPPGLTIEQRLLHLERQNVALKWVGVTAVLILGVIVTTNAFHENDTVSARETYGPIIIKDSQGKVRYWLGATATGDVAQIFYDQNGTERYSVNVFKNGLANQRLSDSEGNLRVLSYSASREAAHTMFDNNKRMRIRSLVSEQGGSYLTFYDQNEIARSGMFTATDNSIGQWFGDRYGNNKVVTAINPDGSIVIPIPEESDGDKLWKWGDRALTAIGAAKLLNEWINSGK